MMGVAQDPAPFRYVAALQVPDQSPYTSDAAALLSAPVVVVFLTRPVPSDAQF